MIYRIQTAINSISEEMLENVHKNFNKRLIKCIDANGRAFES